MARHSRKMASLLSRVSCAAEKLALRSPKKVASVVSPACVSVNQKRNLAVHECVSMALLKDAGVPVPKFGVAKTAEEAKQIAVDIDSNDLVVKAQVLAGGRGKGLFAGGAKGGVRLVYSPEEVEEAAGGMIGDFLITKQTGAEGRICNTVMVTERKYTRKEFYIAFMNERAFNGPVCIASSEGGVNIEEVAEKNPDAIVKYPIDVVKGLDMAGAKEIASMIGINPAKVDEVGQILLNLYDLFSCVNDSFFKNVLFFFSLGSNTARMCIYICLYVECASRPQTHTYTHTHTATHTLRALLFCHSK